MNESAASINRRIFLATSGASLGLLATGCQEKGETSNKPDSVSADNSPPTPDSPSGKFQGVAELFDVEYTDSEWNQLLAIHEELLEGVRITRKLDHPNSLAPAQIFDPRLPGVAYDLEESTFRISAQTGELPSDSEDIVFASATQLAHWIRTRQITSLELTELYLNRIHKHNTRLQCFITVTAELARKQAKEADAEIESGRYRGALHGLPYGLKDLLDTEGISTTWGAEPYKTHVPDSDAHIVKKLKEAGAVLLGKTSCGAIAYGDIWYGGVTRNPWDPREGSSGSSAGSASATAAGLVAFSIGTETVGSIVSPSVRCGVTGLRPTFGRVGRTGAMALCWSLDKIGAICRSVEDAALVLKAINGFDPEDASSIQTEFSYDPQADLKTTTVGYDPNHFSEEGKHALNRAALETIESLGIRLKEIELPRSNSRPLILELLVESAAAFEALTLSNRDDELRWQGDRAFPNSWRAARFISAVDYIQINRLRRTFMKEMNDIFRNVDLIIGDNFGGGMLEISNYTGHPQLTIPCGFKSRKVSPAFEETSIADGEVGDFPASIGMWGPLFGENKLLSVGNALEKALNLNMRPPMA